MINGILFRDMIVSAANNLDNNKAAVNDLNVFPVPDGDTGTNMSMTLNAAKTAVAEIQNENIGAVAELVATAMLKGARGNSGVILSLLFRGFSKHLKGIEEVDGFGLAKALETGVKMAYGAVMRPTEGTILTVARVSAEKGMRKARGSKDGLEVFETIRDAAEQTLNDTPNMLPVLKQAIVVDAGGKGFVVILDGMLSVLRDNLIIEKTDKSDISAAKADFESFDTENIKFAYCTEFIVQKKENAETGKIRSFLERMGDSVVCVEDEEIIKVHVHTNNPGKVIEEALLYGYLINIKIENMKQQHTEMASGAKEQASQKSEIAEPVKEYGFVAVAAGDGLASVFRDLGADAVVEGGQTMNPSTEDLLQAVNGTPARTVFILPNNKNIILAAEQVVSLCEKIVVVIPTKTIPQGISAMLEFNDSVSPEQNIEAMTDSIGRVKTGQITFAARDSEFDGHKIKEGELLGLVEGKVKVVAPDMKECFKKVFDAIVEDNVSFINVFYGQDADEEEANSILSELDLQNAEINLVSGGQPVYYYIISAEYPEATEASN